MTLQSDMPKTDDTNTIPEPLNAPWIKRFFKRKLGMTVRVRGANTDGYMDVWVPNSDKPEHRWKLVYELPLFPDEVGKRACAVVYPNKGWENHWCGNIHHHSIAMPVHQWRQVLQSMIDDPIEMPEEETVART